jgi:DNA-binding response OmpR family regulator
MRKKRILLVDDDIATTRLLKIGLEKTGSYEVKEENSATQVLSTARSFKPDLAVLDVCMPNLDGGDVAAQMKKDSLLKNTPVFFLTSIVSEDEAGAHALTSGGYQFIPKPVNLQKLVRLIEDTLASPTTS